MFDNKCSIMVTGNGTPPIAAPSSIHIDFNQFKKEPHHCKFENCQNHRRGYNDFCREHKAIGKIISGRIAREKAIAKIAARDKTNHATEVNPSSPSQIKYLGGTGSFFEELIVVLMVIPIGVFLYVFLLTSIWNGFWDTIFGL